MAERWPKMAHINKDPGNESCFASHFRIQYYVEFLRFTSTNTTKSSQFHSIDGKGLKIEVTHSY